MVDQGVEPSSVVHSHRYMIRSHRNEGRLYFHLYDHRTLLTNKERLDVIIHVYLELSYSHSNLSIVCPISSILNSSHVQTDVLNDYFWVMFAFWTLKLV